MRPSFVLYISLACGGLLPLVATAQQTDSAQPTTPATQPPAASKTPSSPPATSTATTAPSTSPEHSKSSQELTADEKRLVSQGYHLEVKNGEKTFCRREVVLGSHFEKKVCGSAESLLEEQKASREMTERSQRVGTQPQGH